MKDHELAREQAGKLFQTLKLHCEVSEPIGEVRDGWPSIRYTVTFCNQNGFATSHEYRLGIGHVDWAKAARIPNVTLQWSADYTLENILRAQATGKGHLIKQEFKPKLALLAGRIARQQKVSPSCFEVLATLCRDGLDAHQNNFKDWANNLGFGDDSIKAQEIYRQCQQIFYDVEKLLADGKSGRRGLELVEKFSEFQSRF